MGADERTIIIPEHTRAIIKRVRLLNPFGEYLFMTDGKRINSTRFNYHLYKACKEVGIPERSTHKIDQKDVRQQIDRCGCRRGYYSFTDGVYRYQDYERLLLLCYTKPEVQRKPDF